jgi:hypothetical protein
MKIKAVILLAILVTLGGCDWIRSLGEVELDTDLTVNVPVASVGKKSAETGAAIQDVSFTGSAMLYLDDNDDISPYLEKLRKIDLQTVTVTINGLGSGQTISSITLSVNGIGTIATHANITSTTGAFVPQIDAAKLQDAGEKLVDDLSITVTVSGTSTTPIANIVNIIFGAKVTAGALD